ncbi:MAG TPA: alpha/beta hydrolase, partial [Trueperaceae bacterium]
QKRSWFSRLIMSTPQMRRLGPVLLRQLASEPGQRLLWAGWYDPSQITPEQEALFREPFTVEGWDVALWRLSQADAPGDLDGQLGGLDLPVLVVAGQEDGVVPVEQSERLAAQLPDAELVMVPMCGHAVQEECPEELASAVTDWLAE